MLKKFVSFTVIFLTLTSVSFARVRCSADGSRDSKCVGYNDNGEYVSLRSRTNSLGITTTQGRVGNRYVNTRTHNSTSNSGTRNNAYVSRTRPVSVQQGTGARYRTTVNKNARYNQTFNLQ